MQARIHSLASLAMTLGLALTSSASADGPSITELRAKLASDGRPAEDRGKRGSSPERHRALHEPRPHQPKIPQRPSRKTS